MFEKICHNYSSLLSNNSKSIDGISVDRGREEGTQGNKFYFYRKRYVDHVTSVEQRDFQVIW